MTLTSPYFLDQERHHPSSGAEISTKLNYRETVPSLLRIGGPIALASVLEPVGYLGQRQARLLGQRALLIRSGVAILSVAIFQGCTRLLFEAVDGLLTVPDRLR